MKQKQMKTNLKCEYECKMGLSVTSGEKKRQLRKRRRRKKEKRKPVRRQPHTINQCLISVLTSILIAQNEIREKKNCEVFPNHKPRAVTKRLTSKEKRDEKKAGNLFKSFVCFFFVNHYSVASFNI